MAEAVGFEPTDGCPSPVFKTGPIGHYGTPPRDTVPARHLHNAAEPPAVRATNLAHIAPPKVTTPPPG